MSLLPFLVIAFGVAAASVVTRGQPTLEISIGLGGLVAATIAAMLISAGDQLKVGGSDVLVATAYGRLFLVLGGVSGVLLCLIGLAGTWQPNLPAALLVGLGGIGVALSVPNPTIALIVLTASAIASSLAALPDPVSGADVQVVVRAVRVIVIAGTLAIVTLAWANPSSAGSAPDAEALGLADLAIVLAVAVRFGAIPFHRPVARLSDTAPGTAVPLLLVWAPAALAVVVLGATDGSSVPLLVPFGVGRAVIVAIASASLVLGAIGAWLQDDLEHVVGYSIVQDAGFVLLGLAMAGGEAHEPVRTWLLILVASKAAFAGWATVVRARFRTARLPELGGWARRSPLLGIGLAGIVVGTLGVPGLLAWHVRGALVQSATGGPLAVVLLLAGLASLTYYGRILVVGLVRPSLLVAAAPGDRPVAIERHASAVDRLSAAWRANRAPIGAVLVLVLVVVSVGVSVGGLGGPEAARATSPTAGQP